MQQTALHIDNLCVGYGKKRILNNLNLNLRAGELTCLLGPNGSGKSTLIRSISGVQQVLEGQVLLKQKVLSSFSKKDIAREIGLVLTDNQAPGNLTVFALVALGRFPYTSWLGNLSDQDKEVIERSLEAAGVLAMADRHVGELSDGEKQKVMIARALAQETDVLILDEPTAHLDSPNRIEIFHLLKDLAVRSNRAILISTHDIETALTYADILWLVNQGSITTGIPEDLVLKGHLEEAFKTVNVHFSYERGGFVRSIAEKKRPIRLEGDMPIVHWVERALLRSGYFVSPEEGQKITVSGTMSTPEMRIEGSEDIFKNIEQLLSKLKNEEN